MMSEAYSYLKLLSDITRLRLITLINALPDICVCQLMEIMGLPQTTISKALGVIKKSGFIKDRRDGQWVRYRIEPPKKEFPLKNILDSVATDPTIFADLKKLQKVKNVSLDKICCNKPWRK